MALYTNIGFLLTVLVAAEHMTISDATPIQLMSESSHLRTRRSRSDFSDLSPDFVPQVGQVIAGLDTVVQLYAETYGISRVPSVPACINYEDSYVSVPVASSGYKIVVRILLHKPLPPKKRNPVVLKKRLVRDYCYVSQSTAIVMALTFSQALDSKYRLESALQTLISTVAASYGVGSTISCGDNPASLEGSNLTAYFDVLLNLSGLLRCSIPAIPI